MIKPISVNRIISNYPHIFNNKIDKIACGLNHFVVLQNNKAYCFGNNNHGQCSIDYIDTNIIDIAASDNCTVLLDENNDIHQVGNINQTISDKMKTIGGCGNTLYGITVYGQPKIWGYNNTVLNQSVDQLWCTDHLVYYISSDQFNTLGIEIPPHIIEHRLSFSVANNFCGIITKNHKDYKCHIFGDRLPTVSLGVDPISIHCGYNQVAIIYKYNAVCIYDGSIHQLKHKAIDVQFGNQFALIITPSGILRSIGVIWPGTMPTA